MGTSANAARALLVLAAVLWSLGSFFTRLYTSPTGLGLDEPRLDPLQISFFRNLFAGLSLLPLVRFREVRFKPVMGAMVVCFGVMSGLYISALGRGSAANAILLQNTAPFWVYFLGVYCLGHSADSRSLRAILVGVLGALVIVAGNWPRDKPSEQIGAEIEVLLMGLGSGFTYAGVVLFLGWLKHESSAWLMVLNLLGGSAVIAGFVIARDGWDSAIHWATMPTFAQLVVLAVFGAVQMAIPYWLFARGLKSVSAQEAGIITLLEPVLNPIWAYLIAPETESPTIWTLIGGGLLLGALLWRYLPWNLGRSRVTN